MNYNKKVLRQDDAAVINAGWACSVELLEEAAQVLRQSLQDVLAVWMGQLASATTEITESLPAAAIMRSKALMTDSVMAETYRSGIKEFQSKNLISTSGELIRLGKLVIDNQCGTKELEKHYHQLRQQRHSAKVMVVADWLSGRWLSSDLRTKLSYHSMERS